MSEKTLKEMIDDALDEAYILESGNEIFDEARMLLVAMKLSGAPYSFIEQVYVARKNHMLDSYERLKPKKSRKKVA